MKLITGNCLEIMRSMPDDSIDAVVTSPPYNKKGLLGKKSSGNQIWKSWQIDYSSYGDDMEEAEYQAWMVEILDELYRIIKPNGSIFFNHKPRRHSNKTYMPTDFISKSKLDIYQLIVWNRLASPNIRKDILLPTTEHIYWLTKGKPKVYKDQLDKQWKTEVWNMTPDKGTKHPAPFPEQLVENCLLLGTKIGDTILDPFVGSGTSAFVSDRLGRNFIGIDIDSQYMNDIKKRIETI